MKEHYKILGLNEDASIEEIKKAYKLYASKYHPDKHSGDKFFEERFKEIKNAYDYLIQKKINNINSGNQTKERNSPPNSYDKSSFETKENSNIKEVKDIRFHPIIIWILYLFGLFIPFIGAGFMAEASGGVGAVITFVILFGGYIYFIIKNNG